MVSRKLQISQHPCVTATLLAGGVKSIFEVQFSSVIKGLQIFLSHCFWLLNFISKAAKNSTRFVRQERQSQVSFVFFSLPKTLKSWKEESNQQIVPENGEEQLQRHKGDRCSHGDSNSDQKFAATFNHTFDLKFNFPYNDQKKEMKIISITETMRIKTLICFVIWL